VIYRFQVIKQADVVLAMFLQGDHFSGDLKRANFEYYEPITTGDSSLSAVVQSIMAAEVGYHGLALRYFHASVFVDLADLHRNTSEGVHVASAAGVWGALVQGFGGMRDHEGELSFDPRLPEEWAGLTYRLTVRGARVRVDLRPTEMELTVEQGERVLATVRGARVEVRRGEPVTVPLDGQGPRLSGEPPALRGTQRPDGSVVTASVPHASGPNG
jgi:alpha,alpha-trehalose phosphorylase